MVKAGLAIAGGLALLVLLALGGAAVREAAGLPLPGSILGLLVYLLLLATGRFDWTLRAATAVTGLIGALIVPPLVGLALFSGTLLPAIWELSLLLVVTTGVTAVATAVLFRLVGGRG